MLHNIILTRPELKPIRYRNFISMDDDDLLACLDELHTAPDRAQIEPIVARQIEPIVADDLLMGLSEFEGPGAPGGYRWGKCAAEPPNKIRRYLPRGSVPKASSRTVAHHELVVSAMNIARVEKQILRRKSKSESAMKAREALIASHAVRIRDLPHKYRRKFNQKPNSLTTRAKLELLIFPRDL